MFKTRFRELLATTPGLPDELDSFYSRLSAFLLTEHNEDGTHVVDDPQSSVAPADAAYVTVGNTSSLANERALVGTVNEIDVTDSGAGSTVAVGLVADVVVPNSMTAPKVVVGATEGSSRSGLSLTKKVTGIADNTATDVLTVTIPNENHAAAIRLLFVSSNGSTDAFESSRAAHGLVVVARTLGANAVATVTTLSDEGIATVSGGATHTLAYDVSSISGAVNATNTFTIRVTINDSGNLGSNQVVVWADLLNAQSTGITIA